MLRFGIAGWSYDDWKGIVYPRSCKDPLRFCAEYVDVLEINSTFYRVPEAKDCASWVERTRDLPVVFTAKVPQELTHERRLEPALLAATRAGFGPLVDSQRLDALLLQFSHGFVDDEKARAHLHALVAELAPLASLVVEVRHQSWQRPEALELLRALGVSVAHLDWPGAGTGFGLRVTGVNGPSRLAYFRLHGRNASSWFAKGAGRDAIYDWLYLPAEVLDLAARALEIAATAATTLVIANNHFHGKAMKVVLEIMAALLGKKVAVPELLAERYPDLKRIAKPGGQGRLF